MIQPTEADIGRRVKWAGKPRVQEAGVFMGFSASKPGAVMIAWEGCKPITEDPAALAWGRGREAI